MCLKTNKNLIKLRIIIKRKRLKHIYQIFLITLVQTLRRKLIHKAQTARKTNKRVILTSSVTGLEAAIKKARHRKHRKLMKKTRKSPIETCLLIS